MTQVTFNTVPFVILLWYFLLSAPLTYFTLTFIAAFVVKHRERLEHGIHPKHGTSELLDEFSAAHSNFFPGVLFMFGWMMFPVCALVACMIVAWYVLQLVNPCHDEVESEAGS
jgi:hypothetical protein